MKKKILSLVLAVVFVLALAPFTAVPAGAAAFTPITGWEMMHTLKLGINIANTLDAWRTWEEAPIGLDTETMWGEYRIIPERFQSIALKGFNYVRIPVTWRDHLDKDYKIDRAWLDRVQECVDMALAAGLYVILNTHHDDALLAQLIKDGRQAEAAKYLTTVWAQIAERFQNYSEKLLFETMNEPFIADMHLTNLHTTMSDSTNKLNAAALETIRKSGGNNAQRCVLLPTVGAEWIAAEYHEHPANDPYTMVNVHAYEPRAFVMSDEYGGQSYQFTDTKTVDDVFNKLNTLFISKGIPVLMGETGATDKDNETERVKWVNYYFSKAAELEIPLTIWEQSGNATLNIMDMDSLLFYPNITNAIFAAFGLKPGPDFTAQFSYFPYDTHLSIQRDTLERSYSVSVPAGILSKAESLVIEYEGAVGFIDLSVYPSEFPLSGSTEAPGKMIFDLNGITFTAPQGISLSLPMGDRIKIKRVYFDNTPLPPPALPYELKGPYEDGDFTFWAPSAKALNAAEKMVVEYEGKFEWGYTFVRHNPNPWAQFDKGDSRITEEPGRLIFDIRGLEGFRLAFAAWQPGDAAKIKRVYLDTWEGTANPLDTASDWARSNITAAIEKGFVPADIRDNYKSTITRAEFCRMAVMWLEYRLGESIDAIVEEHGIPERMELSFTDTDDANILAAYRLGVTSGTDKPGIFNPNGQFTRQEAATMIMNTCKAAGFDVAGIPPADFEDLDSVPVWAQPGVNFVRANGIMNGDGANFNPAETFSREQSIITFNNIK